MSTEVQCQKSNKKEKTRRKKSENQTSKSDLRRDDKWFILLFEENLDERNEKPEMHEIALKIMVLVYRKMHLIWIG